MFNRSLMNYMLAAVMAAIFSLPSYASQICEIINYDTHPVYASAVNLKAADIYTALGAAYGSPLSAVNVATSNEVPISLTVHNGVDVLRVYVSLNGNERLVLAVSPAVQWQTVNFADWNSSTKQGYISNSIVNVSFSNTGLKMEYAGALGTPGDRQILRNVHFKGWLDNADNGSITDPVALGLSLVDTRTATIQSGSAQIVAGLPQLTLNRCFTGIGQNVSLTEKITAVAGMAAFEYVLEFTNNGAANAYIAWADGRINGTYAKTQRWLKTPYWGTSLFDLSLGSFSDHIKYWYNPPAWSYFASWDDNSYGVGLTTLKLLSGGHYHNKTIWSANSGSFGLDQVETVSGYPPILITPGATVQVGGCLVACDAGTNALRQTQKLFATLGKTANPIPETPYAVVASSEFVKGAKKVIFQESFDDTQKWLVKGCTAQAGENGLDLTLLSNQASISCALEMDFSQQRILQIDIPQSDPSISVEVQVRQLGSTNPPQTLVSHAGSDLPDDEKLLAHYKFDETSGLVAADSAGTAHAVVTRGTWTADGFDNGCIYLGGNGYIRLPAGSVDAVTNEVTLSFWAKGDNAIVPGNVIFHGTAPNYAGHLLFSYMPAADNTITFEAGHITPQQSGWPSYYWGWDTVIWSNPTAADWKGQWNHYAFVKNAATGTQRIYRNGLPVASGINCFSPIDSLKNLTIGCVDRLSYQSLSYKGFIDDFRLYSYALTASQVLYLAGGSEQPETDVTFQADISAKTGWVDHKEFELIINVSGNVGDSINISYVDIIPPPAAAPEVVSPYEGWDITDIAVCFSWKKVGELKDYQVQVSRDGDFESAITYDITLTAELCSFHTVDLLDTGLWYWRVRGIDTGLPGNWSQQRSFTVNNDHTKSPLQRPITAENPLFTLEAFKIADLSKFAESIPQDLRPYTAIASDNQYFVYKKTPLEHYAPIASQTNNHLLKTHGPGNMGWAMSLTDVEWLFKNYPNVLGICTGENFWSYWQWDNDGTKDYISRLIMLCAKYGKVYIWGDGNGTTFKWQQFASNDYWINFTAQYGEYMVLGQKNNVNHTMHTTQGALLGMWLSGMMSNLCSWSECWYWNDAGFGELGEYLGPKMGYIDMFPRNFYNISFMHGIAQGAAVFNVEGQATVGSTQPAIWNNQGQTTETFDRYLVPFMRGVVSHKLVPQKADVLAKVKVAIEQPDRFANIAHHGDYGVYQAIYDQTYGFRTDGKWYEYLPNNGKYYFFPLLPYGVNSLGDGVHIEKLADMASPAYVSSVFDTYYTQPYYGSALHSVVGSSVFIQNTNENVDTPEDYLIPINTGNIKQISGQVGAHKYIMGKFEDMDTKFWMQANTEYWQHSTDITFQCVWKPALVASPENALLSAVWDDQLGTYTISLTHLFGAAELTLDSADLNGDGIVDIYDIIAMADNWLFTGDNAVGDFNGDNIVNLTDFVILNQRITP